jgi:hypothetical protein
MAKSTTPGLGILLLHCFGAAGYGQIARVGTDCEFYSPSQIQLTALPCVPAFLTTPDEIDPHRSLFVHDRSTLDARDFTLHRTLTQMAAQVSALVPGTTAAGIFRQFRDTQGTAAQGVTTGPHCDDNGGTLNGFPMACHPTLAKEALGSDAEIEQRMQEYVPLALVNRLDLAHENWRNCGEYRILYVKYQDYYNGSGKPDSDMIFEAVLPNQKPGCRDGCLPVAKFWKSLSQVADPALRAQMLESFFYTGLPGFRPVVHVDHYGALGLNSVLGNSRGGQIRTNYYFLKEFKTMIDCGNGSCQFRMVPVPVQQSPFAPLWNEDLAHVPNSYLVQAQGFQAGVLAQKATLGAGKIMDIDYSVKLEHDAAYNIGTFYDWDRGYSIFFDAATGATASFRSGLATGGLTAKQMLGRAGAMSCLGCHQPHTFVNGNHGIGLVTTPTGQTTQTWPDSVSLGVNHIDAYVSSPPELSSAVYGTGKGHRLSPALLDVFLPARKQFLETHLNASHCVCQNQFLFLSDAVLTAALRIAETERQASAPQFTALADEIRANVKLPSDAPERQRLERATAQLFLAFEDDLQMKLERAGVAIPPSDPTALRPQPLYLNTTVMRSGAGQAQEALRVTQLIDTLKALPARRTVTGSYRVH